MYFNALLSMLSIQTVKFKRASWRVLKNADMVIFALSQGMTLFHSINCYYTE